MVEENKDIYVARWLLLITFLVALMIIIGGLTRLTDSGLSITKWDLVSGIIPPLSLNDWENFFSLYKKIPEYKLLNSSMTLEEFKFIYWWEYSHRLLGRAIGLLYLIPLLYFTFKKMIKKSSLVSFYIILLLIFSQGVIGWFMVKSGLTERTDVSHYFLSLHLTLAFFIFVLLLWNYLKFKNFNDITHHKKLPSYLTIIFILFIIVQISVGAFVSGLDAGQIYQTWPLMNQTYFPDDSNLKDLFTLKAFEIPSIVQFVHRNIAYLIFIFYLFILYTIYKNEDFFHLRNISMLIFASLLLQILLGILTILTGVNIYIASMHQIGSIFLVTASLILVFKNSKIN